MKYGKFGPHSAQEDYISLQDKVQLKTNVKRCLKPLINRGTAESTINSMEEVSMISYNDLERACKVLAQSEFICSIIQKTNKQNC